MALHRSLATLQARWLQAKSSLGDSEDWQPIPADVQMLFLEALRLCVSIDVNGVASLLRQHLDDLVDTCCKVSLAMAWRELELVGPAKVDERYGALLGVDSSELLLRRVEQTVAYLRLSVGRNNPDAMGRAYARACELAEGFVLRLSSVPVGEASESAGGVQVSDIPDDESLGVSKPEELVSDEHFQRLSQMFVSSVDDDEGTLSRAIAERDDRHAETERLGQACDAILEELQAREDCRRSERCWPLGRDAFPSQDSAICLLTQGPSREARRAPDRGGALPGDLPSLRHGLWSYGSHGRLCRRQRLRWLVQPQHRLVCR